MAQCRLLFICVGLSPVAIEVSVVNTDDTVSDDDVPSQIYVAGAIFVILLAILIAVQVLANRKA